MSIHGSQHVYTHIGLAAAVDLMSLFIALIFLIRTEKIQSLVSHEGDQVDLQVDLLKRHRPDSVLGLYEIVTHLGIVGVLSTLFSMVFTSMLLFEIFTFLFTRDLSLIPKVFILSGISIAFWRIVAKKAVMIHEQTYQEVDHELKPS